MPGEVVEPPQPLGAFKEWVDLELRDVVQWVTVEGGWLDQMVLKGFANLNNSVVLLLPGVSGAIAVLPG